MHPLSPDFMEIAAAISYFTPQRACNLEKRQDMRMPFFTLKKWLQAAFSHFSVKWILIHLKAVDFFDSLD